MKKFLCYDTNDAASGRVNVDSRGMLRPNSTVPSTNGSTNQHLVTDFKGNMKWEDRLAYEDSRVAVPPEGNNRFIKVADTVPSWLSANKNTKVWVSNNASERVIDISSTGYIINHDGSFMVANDSFPYAIVIMEDDCEFNATPSTAFFPEKGVYFLWGKLSSSLLYTAGIASADSDTPEITWDGNDSMIKKLDKKFLPDQQAVFRLVNDKLIDEKGNAITPKQAKAVGLNFVIRTPDGVARPITASYHDTYVSFCVAEVGSAGYEFANIRVGTSPD